MKNKNVENTGNKPNAIVMLPLLVLVFCVYGDAADTHLLRGLSTKARGNQPSLIYKTLTHAPILISLPALPASPVPVSPVLRVFNEIMGTVTPFISRTVHPVRFIRGPPA